jgi:protein SFI1
MSGFRPTRASPPSKQAFLTATASSVSDVSRGSAVSTSELQALTPQDIEFLDAVIERASPTATTFLTVFKAYNDILNERGIDPQNEVVYYGKLLKLGTLKGKSWGDKWRMVKLQQGRRGDSASQKDSAGDNHRPPTRPPPPPTRTTTRLTARHREDDLLTLHSHQDDTEIVETDAGTETEVDIPQYHHIPKSISRRSPSEPTSTVGPDSSLPPGPIVPVTSRRQMLLPTTRNFRPWDNTSDATEEVRAPSTIFPSYGAAAMDTHVYRPSPYVLRPRSHIDRPLSAQALPIPKLFPTQSRERRKRMINEDDAWTKIKMLQDEREADRFREDRLVETCWAVWRSGFDWIIVCFLSTLSHCYIHFISDRRLTSKYLKRGVSFSSARAWSVGETGLHRN